MHAIDYALPMILVAVYVLGDALAEKLYRALTSTKESHR